MAVWQLEIVTLWRCHSVRKKKSLTLWKCASLRFYSMKFRQYTSVTVWLWDSVQIVQFEMLTVWQFDSVTIWLFLTHIYDTVTPGHGLSSLFGLEYAGPTGEIFFYTGNSICWAHKAAKKVAKKRNHVLVRGGVSQNVWNMSQPLIGGFSQNKVAVCYF